MVIVVINVIYFLRIYQNKDRDCAPGTGGGGYASFPEGQDPGERGGEGGAPYNAPEY